MFFIILSELITGRREPLIPKIC